MTTTTDIQSKVNFLPTRSPYGTWVYKLGFRDEVWFDVHWPFIDRCPRLAGYVLKATEQGLSVYFPTVTHDIGHVIVHYLYTEKYQILEMEIGGTAYERELHQFSTACKVLHVAENLELESLSEFCKKKILRMCTNELRLKEILLAVEESQLDLASFPKLATYLELRLMRCQLFKPSHAEGLVKKHDVPSTIPDILLKVLTFLAKNFTLSPQSRGRLYTEITDMMMHLSEDRYSDPGTDLASMANRLLNHVLAEEQKIDSMEKESNPQVSTANNTSTPNPELTDDEDGYEDDSENDNHDDDDEGCFDSISSHVPPQRPSTPSTSTLKTEDDVSISRRLVFPRSLRDCRQQSLISQKSHGLTPIPTSQQQIFFNSNEPDRSMDSMSSVYADCIDASLFDHPSCSSSSKISRRTAIWDDMELDTHDGLNAMI